MTFLRNLRVRRQPNDIRRGIIQAGSRSILCALGRRGPSVMKTEGDGATPACRILRPVMGFFRHDRVHRPVSAIEFEAIGAHDGWCDAPDNPNYNLPISLPFVASHETMMRDDQLYDIGVVLDWNMPPERQRNRGSAIFLHLCKPRYQPTEGCIAVEAQDMRWLLGQINMETKIWVAR